METEVLMQRLEVFLNSVDGEIKIEADKIKKLISHIKQLEHCLADALRLAHEQRQSRAVAS